MAEEKDFGKLALDGLIARLKDEDTTVDDINEAISMLQDLYDQVMGYHKRWQEEKQTRWRTDEDNLKLMEELQEAHQSIGLLQRTIERQFNAISERDQIIKVNNATIRKLTKERDKMFGEMRRG